MQGFGYTISLHHEEKNFKKGRKYLIIGENHSETHI